MQVLIPIETASRELQSKVYLATLLAERGVRVYLGAKGQIMSLMAVLGPSVYLDKGYHEGQSEKIHRAVLNRGGRVVSLDEEGAVDYDNNSTLFKRYAPALFESACTVFFWGKSQLDLLGHQASAGVQLIVSGHPRFEMLKPGFHAVYERESQALKEQHGSFVLINTNMGFGNNVRGDDFVVGRYGPRFADIEDIIAFDRQKIAAYLPLVKTLARAGHKVVVRPHPEESLEFYRGHFGDLSNVVVSQEGSVIPWLLAARVMIHPDSTTAIESLFLGKPPISFLPEGYPSDRVTRLTLQSSRCCTSEEGVLQEIDRSAEDGFVPEDYPFLEDFFSYSSASSEVIADAVAEVARALPSASPLTTSARLRLYYKGVRHVASKFRKGAALSRQKLRGLNSRELGRRLKTVAEVNPSAGLVRLRRVAGGLFEIGPR